MIIRQLAVIFFIFQIFSLSALNPDRNITQYQHDIWNEKNGLPQNSVHTIIQTKNGYIWFGTQEGLVRFDGVRFSIYKPTNTTELKHSYVFSLVEKRDGKLLIGTREGVTEYGDSTFHFLSQTKDIEVAKMIFDMNNNLWILTYKEKLIKIDQSGEREDFNLKDVKTIYEDRSGIIWISVGKELYTWNNNKLSKSNIDTGNSSIYAMYQDSRGALWVGLSGKIMQVYGKKVQQFGRKHNIPSYNINMILEDEDKNIWFATESDGIIRYTNGKFSRFSQKDGLSDNSVLCMIEDKEKSLWIGTKTGGLNRLRDTKFTFFSPAEGLPIDSFRSITQDRKENIWISSDHGSLVKYNNGKITATKYEDGINYRGITSLLGDYQGGLWIGTSGNGVLKKELGITVKVDYPGLRNAHIRSLFQDPRGVIWIGTSTGHVFTYFRGAYKEITTFKTFVKDDYIRDFVVDKNNNMYVATQHNGLLLYKNGKITSTGESSGLADSIAALFVDSKGVLWIATVGKGIFCKTEKMLTQITECNGLHNNNVFEILEDNIGNLWFSSNTGLFSITHKSLMRVCKNGTGQVRKSVYGLSDGMLSREFNGGVQPSGWKDTIGNLWFPSIKSVVRVDPENIPVNKVVPDVIIEKVIVDGKTYIVREGAPLLLPENPERIEIIYTATSFILPEAMEFKYMLIGFDREWMHVGSRRAAYYNSLEPGSYRFKVAAANSDGIWNETGAVVTIKIAPAFYQTWWFNVLSIVSILLAIMFYVRWRVYKIRRENRKLSMLVNERTKELKELSLRDPLTGLRNRRYLMEVVKPENCSIAVNRKRLKDGTEKRTVNFDKVYGFYLLDIDHFKIVNDKLGHDSGDMVLKRFSELLAESVRANDSVTRWGGEEFLMILRNTEQDHVPVFAENIRKRIAATDFPVSMGGSIRKTCSIGLMSSPFYVEDPDLLSFEQVVRLIDLCLLYAKNHGRNRSVQIIPRNMPPNQEEIRKMLSNLDYGVEKGYYYVIDIAQTNHLNT